MGNIQELIPHQQTGAESNTEEIRVLTDENESKKLFEKARQRLLNVNGWQQLCGPGSALFQLTDASGKEVDRAAQPSDHFKIDIPGPGPVTGEGYDWVKIEQIEEQHEPQSNSDCILMRVRPATNPHGGADDVAHFFSDDATSNFMVRREGNKVIAAVYGRNELPNTKAESAVDKARNAMVAMSAIAGVSKLQWKSLVKGLIS
ncbi:MAG: hypothetical protein WCF67_03150 [Chitinophagaceae bacterium]